MAVLKGSKDQVGWAITLREIWRDQLYAVITEAQGRVDRGTMPQKWLDHVNGIALEEFAVIDKITKASIIIADHKRHLGDILFKQACETYVPPLDE